MGLFGSKKKKKAQEGNHEKLWKRFTDLSIDSSEFKKFVSSDVKGKEKMLWKYANDTDDALWRSDEWLAIKGKSETKKEKLASTIPIRKGGGYANWKSLMGMD